MMVIPGTPRTWNTQILKMAAGKNYIRRFSCIFWTVPTFWHTKQEDVVCVGMLGSLLASADSLMHVSEDLISKQGLLKKNYTGTANDLHSFYCKYL